MINMQVIIWLFPIIFIFHDFEEIIFVEAWIKRNKTDLVRQFPKMPKNLSAHMDNITTSSFIGVIIMIVNIVLLHRFMDVFAVWLDKYQHKVQ